MIPPFSKFIKNSFAGRLITFDPGQTTGYSIWHNQKLIEADQIATFPLNNCVLTLKKFLQFNTSPQVYETHVRIEEYRVYQHMTESHAHNDMHTSRLIGCLETLCVQLHIPYSMCGAGLAKTFATDDKLEAWNFWIKAQKHARDAIRHGIYFYCTPPKQGD